MPSMQSATIDMFDCSTSYDYIESGPIHDYSIELWSIQRFSASVSDEDIC